MTRRLVALVAAACLIAASLPAAALAADPALDPLPDSLAELALDQPARSADGVRPSVLDRSLLTARGPRSVVIRLKGVPTATLAKKGRNAQIAQQKKIVAAQAAFEKRARAIDPKLRVLGRTKVSLNAVIAQVDAKKLAKLARDPAVASIRPVIDYQLDLSETVPYIGARALQDLGLTGTGIRVAVLDSGIDYTHAHMGGPGTLLAYKNAYGTKTKHEKNRKINDTLNGRRLFPTAKVIGGFDFVGEEWPTGPLNPDPDPIDCGPGVIPAPCAGGHGTHVASIIGGVHGVAPSAKFYAVKVCSAVSTSCSGVALLQAMDFALDPNRDGSTADAVDLINMSLGSVYGQAPDDDLVASVENATAAGVLTVASAGNSADKPYVTGTPAAAPSALSVAQTAVPSAVGYAIFIHTSSGIVIREAVHQPWSHAFTNDFAVVGASVQYGNGTGGNLDGCAAFTAGSLTGKVVIVDRGACDFSLKVSNMAGGGAKLGFIGLIAPGDPFEGGLGACPSDLCNDIPGFMVSQSTAGLLKNAANTIDFDPDAGVPLAGHMVGSSSRGPGMVTNLIKPEIGAPGASVSAVAGSGTGTAPFGGTSGAAPMVTGSAALLMGAFPSRSALEVKAVLINTAETEVQNRPAVFGGTIAPITRIGGGEVRVDRAHASPAAAWEDGGPSAALSFGFHDLGANATITKTIRVRNYTGSQITYAISSTFRFADDGTNGAVSLSAPATVTVPANGSATFALTLTVDASKLRTWNLNSGSQGATGTRLTTLEYDGYVWLDNLATAADNADPLHLPWQTLPRPATNITASDTDVTAPATVTLTNAGRAGLIETYSLVGTSPDDPATPTPGDALADVDFRAIGVQTFGVPANFCSANPSFIYAFAVNTWERQTHANAPALFEFDLDMNGDGDVEYAIYNRDLAGLNALSDGRNATFALNVDTGVETAFFFTDHRTNSGNTVLLICAEQLGLNLGDVGDQVVVTGAFAVDFYQSGTVRDFVGPFGIVFGGERYSASIPAGGSIAAGSSTTVTITDTGAAGKNPTESGILLRYLDGLAGNEAQEIFVSP